MFSVEPHVQTVNCNFFFLEMAFSTPPRFVGHLHRRSKLCGSHNLHRLHWILHFPELFRNSLQWSLVAATPARLYSVAWRTNLNLFLPLVVCFSPFPWVLCATPCEHCFGFCMDTGHASKCLGTDTRKPSSPIARSYRFTKFLRCFYDVSNVCFFDFGPGLILHDVTYVGRFCLLILGGRSLGGKHGTFLVFQLSARRGCLHISLQIVAAHWDLETSKVDDFFLCAHLWWRRGHGWRPWTSEASQEIWANAGLWCWHFWERDLRRNQKPASSIPESVE